ncbi:LexA family protein [Candidatus Arsenophonus triatominarum]|uniref:LexA family protein n=1 Tax=Candidatus Arsenophonus triatominarum TaxID=57911 RepID=UPI0007C496E1|nr:S24 family peptidase [Candidatus Arsenophonus triatominarum]
MKKMTINERIISRMRELKLKHKDIVKATKASKGAVSQWINGGNKPSADYVAALAHVLNVSEKWLLEGELNDEVKPYHHKMKKIPLLSLEQAVTWSDSIMHDNPWIETSFNTNNSCFAVKIKGDSMVSTAGSGVSLPEGALLIIDPKYKVSSGLIVAAHLPSSDAIIIKKLIIDGPNHYLVSINPNYRPIQIDTLDCIIGVGTRIEFDLV